MSNNELKQSTISKISINNNNINNNTLYNNASNYNFNFNNNYESKELQSLLSSKEYNSYKELYYNIKEILLVNNGEYDINSDLNIIINEVKKLKAIESVMKSKKNDNNSSQIKFDESNLYIIREYKHEYLCNKEIKKKNFKIVLTESFFLLPQKFKFQTRNVVIKKKKEKEKTFSNKDIYKKLDTIDYKIDKNYINLKEDVDKLRTINNNDNNNNYNNCNNCRKFVYDDNYNNNYRKCFYVDNNYNNYHPYNNQSSCRYNSHKNIINKINQLKNKLNNDMKIQKINNIFKKYQ